MGDLHLCLFQILKGSIDFCYPSKDMNLFFIEHLGWGQDRSRWQFQRLLLGLLYYD